MEQEEKQEQIRVCEICGRQIDGETYLVSNSQGKSVQVCASCHEYECAPINPQVEPAGGMVTPKRARESMRDCGVIVSFDFMQQNAIKDDFGLTAFKGFLLDCLKVYKDDNGKIKAKKAKITKFCKDRYTPLHILKCNECDALLVANDYATLYKYSYTKGGCYCHKCASKIKMVKTFTGVEVQAKYIKEFEGKKILQETYDLLTNDEFITTRHGYSESLPYLPITDCKKYQDFAGYGFELEIEMQDDADDEEYGCCEYSGAHESILCELYREFGALFYGKSDGSLNDFYGIEIVTRPASADFWQKFDFNKFGQLLNKYDYASGCREGAGCCGLHIHASRKLFGNTKEIQQKNLAKLYLFFIQYSAKLQKFAGRSANGYCSEFSQVYDEMTIYEASARQQRENDRYKMVNFRNEDTIEFRLFDGTTNPDELRTNILFLDELISNLKRYDKQSKYLDSNFIFANVKDPILRKRLIKCELLGGDDKCV